MSLIQISLFFNKNLYYIKLEMYMNILIGIYIQRSKTFGFVADFSGCFFGSVADFSGCFIPCLGIYFDIISSDTITKSLVFLCCSYRVVHLKLLFF